MFWLLRDYAYVCSPSNGQNIIELMDQSTKKWCPGRERFDCFIHELSGPIEVAVRDLFFVATENEFDCFWLMFFFRVFF